jgi:hypothetical protein
MPVGGKKKEIGGLGGGEEVLGVEVQGETNVLEGVKRW